NQLTLSSLKLLAHYCTQLHLHFLELGVQYGIRGIEELRQIWPNATTLNLKGYKDLTDAQFHSCVQKGACADIQVIDLTGCRQITDASIADIGQNCPNLQAIHLEGTQILPFAFGK